MTTTRPWRLSRRNFLTHSCASMLSTAALGGSMLTLGAARAYADVPSDYRALVCVLLAGGNDSFNMLVPNDADQYGDYAARRADLALPQADLLPLAGQTPDGRNYAVHPGMTGLKSLYDGGNAAFLANVGTLLESVDAAAVEAGAAELPLGLFSHSDQIAQWQTSLPHTRTAEGWGGRMADLLMPPDPSGGISMNISLAGSNVFQSGVRSREYSITSDGDGVEGINAYGDGTDFGIFRKRMVDELLSVEHTHVFRREYRGRLRQAIEAQAIFAAAMANAPRLNTTFSANGFSAALRQIARVIGVADTLDARRQTFFVTVGGWDHHDEVLDKQAAMLPVISEGLREFRDALLEINALDKVVTFTTSDFGRTLTSNGKGSDHGWGGHHVVMGGPVRGGEIYGSYPLLSAESPLDVGRGVYVPTLAVDEYFAELALWFGVAPGDLARVLPNVGRFYSPGSGTPPVGFLL